MLSALSDVRSTVLPMEKIPAGLFDVLQKSVSTDDTLAPAGVVHLAAALLGAPSSIASAASVDLRVPTRWTFDVIADGRLAHGAVEYDTERYTWDEEVHPFGPPPKKATKEAWVRPLSNVVQLQVAEVWRQSEAGIAIGAVTIAFADGFEHTLPAQDRLYRPAQVQRAEAFYEALRAAIGF